MWYSVFSKKHIVILVLVEESEDPQNYYNSSWGKHDNNNKFYGNPSCSCWNIPKKRKQMSTTWRGKAMGSSKSVGFILSGPWVFKQILTAIHLIVVEIFAASGAILLAWLKTIGIIIKKNIPYFTPYLIQSCRKTRRTREEQEFIVVCHYFHSHLFKSHLS